MTDLRITEHGNAVRFNVRVQPRASRSQIDGLYGDAIKLRVAAPPVDGAANEAVIELLAKSLGVPRRAVSVVGGESSRSKIIEVHGATAQQVENLLTASA